MSSSSSREDAPFADFLAAVPQATNETTLRELFVILVQNAFADQNFATTLALGAEHRVKFSQRGLVRRGRIDSLVENIIIEFKLSLTADSQRNEARDQLRAYVAGAWAEDGSYRRPYVCIATDGARWYVYTPRVLDVDINPQQGSAANVELDEFESWSATTSGDAAASLRRFLNRTLLRKNLVSPTAKNFAQDFGLSSPAYHYAREALEQKSRELASNPQMRLYEASWKADLQVAYGHLDYTGDLFIRHTYLALLARLLVWATLERRAAEPEDVKRALDRTYFISRRIGNLVEDDYFAWYQLPSDTDVAPVLALIVRHLSTYRLDDVREDVLKPLYEELIDPDMRHDLGEYYTPDWLANAIVERLLDEWRARNDSTPRMLDPSCGSGTFLRAAIAQIRRNQDSEASAEERLSEIIACVHGMDVHPLAVIIARATYFLAVADLVRDTTTLVNFPVYLCNSISGGRAKRTTSLFGDFVALGVGEGPAKRTFDVPEEFVLDGAIYDEAIGTVVDIARSIGNSRTAAHHAYEGTKFKLRKLVDRYPHGEELVESLGNMSVYIAELTKRGEDSIYGFLLRNRYRSVLLRQHFDILMGNPPWLTMADIESGEYRDLLLRRNEEYQVAPRTAGEQAHTEIATVFLIQTAMQFLRQLEGDSSEFTRIGFVLPRSVFTATHHRIFRQGQYDATVDITEIWDLEDVTPLFNVPACVVFASRSIPRPNVTKKGRRLHGRLPARDPDQTEISGRIRITATQFGLRFLGNRSAWAEVSEDDSDGAAANRLQQLAASASFAVQPYRSRFRQGAILYPQTLMVVERVGGGAPVRQGPVTVRNDSRSARHAKLLEDIQFQCVVDAETLFTTVVAEHIIPFALRTPLWTVVLPCVGTPADETFGPVSSDDLRSRGLVNTADWLDFAEQQWAQVRKASESSSLYKRLDHLGHMSHQAGMRRFVVVYTASGSRVVGAVLDTSATPYPYVARDNTYWMSTDDEREAHYVAGFLNSDFVHNIIVDFMTRGLLGARDVHKRVLDVPWPEWSPEDSDKVAIAELSARCAEHVQRSMPTLPLGTGAARNAARKVIPADLLAELEERVATMSHSAA